MPDEYKCVGKAGAVAGGCAGAGVSIWAWVKFAMPAMFANPHVGVIPAWLITLLGPGEAALCAATGVGACAGAAAFVSTEICCYAMWRCAKDRQATAANNSHGDTLTHAYGSLESSQPRAAGFIPEMK